MIITRPFDINSIEDYQFTTKYHAAVVINCWNVITAKWQLVAAQEIIAIYSTAFGSVITYFFTKRD